MMFSDNAGIRDRKYPLRMTYEEGEFLRTKAEELGIRDVATLIRMCIRDRLMSGAQEQQPAPQEQ